MVSEVYRGKISFPTQIKDNVDYANRFSAYLDSFYRGVIPIESSQVQQKSNNFMYVVSKDLALLNKIELDFVKRGLAKAVEIESVRQFSFKKDKSFFFNGNFIN